MRVIIVYEKLCVFVCMCICVCVFFSLCCLGEDVRSFSFFLYCCIVRLTMTNHGLVVQEILQDPRLLVAIEGRLMTLSEALPHLIAASVFRHSLLQVRERQWTFVHVLSFYFFVFLFLFCAVSAALFFRRDRFKR